jgi:hypothetical protein
MDITSATRLANILIDGGSAAVVVLLLLAIAWLIADRRRVLKKLASEEQELLDEVHARDLKLDNLTDSYFRTIMGITEALNGLKIVLAEINGRLLK